jgi:hypothetical protein
MPMIPPSEPELVLLVFEQLLLGRLNINVGFELLASSSTCSWSIHETCRR